jgi:hypothetical protein
MTFRKDLQMKKNFMKYALVALGFALGSCTAAHGLVFGPTPHPEVDPSLAISAVTLLAGSLAVLRVRRQK